MENNLHRVMHLPKLQRGKKNLDTQMVSHPACLTVNLLKCLMAKGLKCPKA